jgi:nucleotide-binding universal stress UspA family protein
MTMVVGYAPDGRARAVLHLAGMLARSAGDELVLCAVVPMPWPPSPARVDAEYRAYLERTANDALEQARARLPADVSVTPLVHHARSAPAGLLELAEQHEAGMVVVGFGTGVHVGSATGRLLHSSHVPVAVAPRGFRCRLDARVARVTAAYGGYDDELVLAAAALSAGTGAALRVAAFAVRSRAPFTAGLGSRAEEPVIHEWERDVQSAARRALEPVGEVPTVVGHGQSWDEALEDVEWEDGDVLVVGSSSTAPSARVFLGSRATKIVRHSPVPVIVVPRAAQRDAGQGLAHDPVGDQG